jgi:hypothetical protein
MPFASTVRCEAALMACAYIGFGLANRAARHRAEPGDEFASLHHDASPE